VGASVFWFRLGYSEQHPHLPQTIMRILKYFVVALLVYLVACQVTIAITKTELTIEDQIIIVAAKYNFNNINFLLGLAEIESRSNPDIKHLDTNNRYSYGLLQFQQATYTSLCVDRYGIDTDIYSVENQVHCFIKIYNDLGPSFVTSTGG
jgi:hypothetical protein